MPTGPQPDNLSDVHAARIASFSSFAGRKATFLLAAICIVSSVAGLRPERASRFANLKSSKATDSDAVSLLQVHCHALDHSREQILGQLFRQLMPFRQLLEDARQHDGRGSAFCHSAARYDVECGTESRLG
jgi:hypothetical protein